jgi:hypothetical protein
MPNLNPNSTNYVHSHEPSTNDLVQAMDYDPYGQPVLRIDDTTKQHTSKNRVKVSGHDITDFSTYTFSKNLLNWDEQVTGTGSVVHAPEYGMVKFSVGSNAGDEVIRQTKRVQRYIPGRSAEVAMSVIFGTPTTGIRKRIGLFDNTDGVYFEDGGDGTYYVATRRKVGASFVDTRVAREDWNYDKLDGTGPSGIVADPTALHHIVIEYEWYGAGQVEFKYIIDNNSFPVHRFNHANRQAYPWASTASLPVRVEMTNVAGTAGTHEFYQGSHSFATEGNTELLGRQNSISNAITGKTLSLANTFYPVVAIRLKTTALNSVVLPDSFSGATLDNTNVFVRLIEGANVTGGTWVSYSDDSPVEYNITATGYTNGIPIETVYVSATNQGNIFHLNPRAITQIDRKTTTTLGDTSDTLVIAMASTNANKKAFASLGWIEVR